jgi:general secretion pathway protein D
LILTPYVIESQDDLRKVFTRKMRERQEFLDRYFVFNSDWEPPRDYARSNGLVEEIRQAFAEIAEVRRLDLEGRPSDAKTHQPTEPLDLPVDVGAGQTAPGGAPAAPTTGAPAAPRPAPAPRRRRNSSELDLPGRDRPRAARADVPLVINPGARSVAVRSVPDAASLDRVE